MSLFRFMYNFICVYCASVTVIIFFNMDSKMGSPRLSSESGLMLKIMEWNIWICYYFPNPFLECLYMVIPCLNLTNLTNLIMDLLFGCVFEEMNWWVPRSGILGAEFAQCYDLVVKIEKGIDLGEKQGLGPIGIGHKWWDDRSRY